MALLVLALSWTPFPGHWRGNVSDDYLVKCSSLDQQFWSARSIKSWQVLFSPSVRMAKQWQQTLPWAQRVLVDGCRVQKRSIQSNWSWGGLLKSCWVLSSLGTRGPLLLMGHSNCRWTVWVIFLVAGTRYPAHTTQGRGSLFWLSFQSLVTWLWGSGHGRGAWQSRIAHSIVDRRQRDQRRSLEEDNPFQSTSLTYWQMFTSLFPTMSILG